LGLATEAPFASSSSSSIFFCTKLLYIYLSVTQIKYGFPSAESFATPFLTKDFSGTRCTVFWIYRMIPFLFELRTLLDWMLTTTALNMWEVFKLEVGPHDSNMIEQCTG
jgi:hypothetical protein